MAMENGHSHRKTRTSGSLSTKSDDLAVSPSRYFNWKSSIGRVIALLLLVPGVPMTLFMMLLIRLTSKGPAIYPQIRVGKHGKTFKLYKLRTMSHDAEQLTGPVWTQRSDPRITRLGRFLREHHLDELPQLINVIKGDMDLVGPRPERPEFATVLAKRIPEYLQRLQVLPGVTGLAQINLPPDSDLESVRQKLGLDLEYIERGNLFLDIRLSLATLMGMCGWKTRSRSALLRLNPTTQQNPESVVNKPADFRSNQRVDMTPAAIARSENGTNGEMRSAASSESRSASNITTSRDDMMERNQSLRGTVSK